MPPRKPTADSANIAPAARPSSVARTSMRGAWLERHGDHAGGCDQDGGRHPGRHDVAEENEAEQRRLHRLGLDVGIDHHERAIVHGGKHQGGGGHLRQRAEDDPGPKGRRRPRKTLPERDHHAGKEDEREWKPEQKTHVGRAHGAKPRGQFALCRVAHGLRGGGDDGEDGPEPRRIEHPATFARRSTLWDRTSVAALGPLGDRTLLVIHDHEQVEVADDRFGPGALLHTFAPVASWPCRAASLDGQM